MNDLDAGITHDRYEYRTKFKVKQALWNPQLDVLALASADGEICLKRYHWKNGWKKKIAAEPLFFNKWSRSIYGGSQENAGPFASMCWSPCGRVLAVAFEEGVCHLLEVNDALILYSLRVSTAVRFMKWLDVPPTAAAALRSAHGAPLFAADPSAHTKKCEHLRTKDSENNRDHYKVVFGVQEFCHSLVQKSLLGTSLVVVAETPDGVAFHVYSGGCFLVRTVLFDESFMNDRFDKSSLEVRDLVVLPNGRLQFAVSASAHHVPRFDRTAGYAPPADPTEEAYGECTFLLDYDVGFGNAEWMRATAKLAVRSCHIFHLLTAFRETFFRTCSEWETVSEQFHNNVFGSLYEKYREETKGQVADFALDFMAYILTGSSAEAFARAFFKDIKPKDWKPARDFVVKHIPNFLQSINRHLHPLVDALFVHLTCLQGELQQFERQCTYGWGAERRMSLELLNEMKQMEKSAPLRQIERTIFGIRHLGAIVKRLGDVAHTNWAELKYVLQLLSSHPDNEQLEMDIEDDCDGIPRQVDYEVLLKFIVNALVDPSKRHLLENPMELISEWQQRLAAGDRAGSAESLLCNPNWLKHRVFDKIAPLLGTCPEIPVPTDWPRKKDADDPMDERAAERAECRATSTVTDALRWCFNSIEDVYLSGTTQLHNANPQLMPVRTACLEYCHPEAVGKLRLFNWNELKRPHRSMPAEEAAVCLRAMGEFEEKLGASCQSLVMVCRLRLPRRSIDADETERKFAATVQLFVSADSADPLPLELASACSPDSIARLFAFGEMHECTKGMTDTNAEKLAAAFEANEIHVLDAEMYGGGALHLLCTPCESPGGANGRETPPSSTAQSNGFPVHILRVDVCGNLRKIEATPLTYCADPLLLTAPGRAVGVLFERKFETVKWFELEAPAESRSLLSKAVLATPREREMSALSDLTPRKTPAGFRAQTPPASSTGRPAPYSRPSAQRRRRVPPATAQRLSFTLPASQTTPATSRDEEAPPSWRNAATPTSTGRHPRLQRLSTRRSSQSSDVRSGMSLSFFRGDTHERSGSDDPEVRTPAVRRRLFAESSDEEEDERAAEAEDGGEDVEDEEMDEETRQAIAAGALVVELHPTPTPSPTGGRSPVGFRLRSPRGPSVASDLDARILDFDGDERDEEMPEEEEREDAYDEEGRASSRGFVVVESPFSPPPAAENPVEVSADGEVLNIPSPVASTITVSYDSSFPPSNESSRPSSPQAAAGSSTATRTAPRRSTRRRFTAELVISDGAEASTATEQPPAADVNDNELPNAQWEQEQMRAMLENLDAQTEAAARAIATVISANSDPIDRPIPTHIRRPTADSGSSARTAVTREQIYGRRHTRPQQPAASTSAATPSTSRSGGSRSKATSGSPPALRRSQRRARATTSAATNTSPLPSASASTSRLNSFFDELEREAGPPPITPARSRRPDESDDERDVQDIVDSFFDPDGQ